MKILAAIFFFIILNTQIAVSQRSQKTYDDLVATVSQLNTPLLARVQKIVDVDYKYILVPTWSWTQFPDMMITFHLEFPQLVSLFYNIVTSMPVSSAAMGTRIIIDDKEYRQFRRYSAYTAEPSLFLQSSVWLEKGDHTLKL